MQKVIGGEFDLDITNMGKLLSSKNSSLFSSGRAALYHILKKASKGNQYKTILLPDYLCESIIQSAQKTNIAINFYKINEDLTINFNYLESKLFDDSIVLLVNYFGCIDIGKQITAVRAINNNACIIADNVQAFFSMQDSKDADYSFTSFRKIFAIPDGALVYSNHGELDIVSDENTFVGHKIAGGVLKHFAECNSIDDSLYLKYLNIGEKAIDQNYNSVASEFSQILYEKLDLCSIAIRRKNNFSFLNSELLKLGITPILMNYHHQVPLFLPIRIKNRDSVRRQMFAQNIYCPVHWPCPEGFALARAEELSKNELSLIVDQRYDENDMKRIIDIIKKNQ